MGSDVREALKSRFLLDSNLFLIEFIRNMRSASPLIKTFFTLRGDTKRNACIGTFFQLLNCVYYFVRREMVDVGIDRRRKPDISNYHLLVNVYYKFD